MDNVTIVLQVLIEIHLHTVTVAAQVVAGQVHQHHVLGILLRVVAQILGTLAVGLGIARTLGGACNGVDIGLASFYAAMRLRRRTEDAETAKVEVEQIRAGG